MNGSDRMDLIPEIANPLTRRMHKGINTTCDEGQTLIAGHTTGQSGKGDAAPLVAFQSSQSGVREVEAHATLDSNMGSRRHNGVFNAMQVRRITPTEAERLQGFPDGWTAIPFRGKPAADGPRYKALGNSMAVPCMAWLGRRIQSVSDLA